MMANSVEKKLKRENNKGTYFTCYINTFNRFLINGFENNFAFKGNPKMFI
jgi:hypothetical protein